MKTEHLIATDPQITNLIPIVIYDSNPMLLYGKSQEEHALCIWADCTSTSDTWVYAILTPQGFNSFLTEQHSYRQTIENAKTLIGVRTNLQGDPLHFFPVNTHEFLQEYGPTNDADISLYMPAFRTAYTKRLCAI